MRINGTHEIGEQVEASSAEEEACDTPEPEPEPATKRSHSPARRVATSSRHRTPKSTTRRSAVTMALKDPEPAAGEAVVSEKKAKRTDAEDEPPYTTDSTSQPPGLAWEQINLITAVFFVLGALFLWGTGLDKVIADAM